MANYGLWQGLEKATGRAAATGMQILNYRQQQERDAASAENQRQQLKLSQDAGARAERQQKINDENAARDSKLNSIDVMFERLGVSNPEVQVYVKKRMGASIVTGPSGLDSISTKDGKAFVDAFFKDDVAQRDVTIMTARGYKKAADDIDVMLNNPEAKWKDDDKEKSKIERDKLRALAVEGDNKVAELSRVPAKTVEQIEVEAAAKARGTAAGTPLKETPGQKLQRDKALAFYKESLKDSTGQAVQTFETQHYGKLVPELRGSPEYIKKLYEAKKAGAMNINIAGEKFDIQKQATAGEIRTGLTTNKDDNSYFEANSGIFNSINEKNEVTYWDKTGETGLRGKLYDEEAKIIKLSPAAIKAGWTPKIIQEAANEKGKTVQEVLKDIGIIK